MKRKLKENSGNEILLDDKEVPVGDALSLAEYEFDFPDYSPFILLLGPRGTGKGVMSDHLIREMKKVYSRFEFCCQLFLSLWEVYYSGTSCQCGTNLIAIEKGRLLIQPCLAKIIHCASVFWCLLLRK